MKFGVFTFGSVEMPDRGSGPPAPTDRRYTQEEMWRTTEQLVDLGIAADRIGYDSYWFTEHHFQYEGYEVTPNALLLGTWLAAKTERIRLGALFNIVPQWHPLRLAEDFATLHNLTRGRAVLGVGRGTVPRELLPLSPFGVSVGSHDNPDAQDADAKNRAVFAESVELMRLALDNETFAYHGEFFDAPPAGIPDRGGFVEELTLVPRPLYPYEIWQAVTSPPTLEQVPKWGHTGVFWNMHHAFVKRFWDRYGEVYEETHGHSLAPGDSRRLVVSFRIGDTREAAIAASRPGHDEFWKFLGPYGWSRGYMGEDGKPAAPGLIPTLEQSMEQRMYLVGTAEDVAEGITFYRELLGCDYMILFPQFAGDPFALAEEQLERFMSEVVPLLG
ncbi:MAG: LLM class flavin-dependent oxidoreductase [Acidimicrobiia bacterium]|nr:LLM class flavin-dependent oxidoreductase [Acidimicrobiia bacterium]MDH4307557.1 LLM class flavin-dependent oxidoreductase [Acidimicrobiia bacterium]MDH5293781.1 LLM class flavin-dependent oxidoreductase [Acidimicrobiia bacterium]